MVSELYLITNSYNLETISWKLHSRTVPSECLASSTPGLSAHSVEEDA
jgi:hypothetical protein